MPKNEFDIQLIANSHENSVPQTTSGQVVSYACLSYCSSDTLVGNQRSRQTNRLCHIVFQPHPKQSRTNAVCSKSESSQLAVRKLIYPLLDIYPRPAVEFRHNFLVAFLGSLANFEEGMQKALDKSNRSKKCLPCFLSGQPAIRIHRIRRVVRVNLLGFCLKIAVSLSQGWFISRQ